MSEQPAGGAAKKKIVEPTFHFASSLMKIGEDYTTDKIQVTEFVKGGQLLASFPNFHRMAAKGYAKAPLEPGEHTKLTEDKEGIVATVPGYPKVQQVRRPEVAELVTVVAIEPLFRISPDTMQAGVVIHPPLASGRGLQQEDLRALMVEQGIVFGIDAEAVEEAERVIRLAEKEFKHIIIARGQQVGRSTDAFLRYDMEIGPIAGKMLENGTIDFRERRVMVGVKAGQCIATKIPPIQGKPGINIYGERTPAPPGKDLKIQLHNDVKFLRDTLQVVATKDGVLSIVNDSAIKVCSHQILRGDVDYKTGNIESMNCLTINGDVHPGFKVTAVGDISISGEVMAARIESQGNIVVKGGITGKDSALAAAGDADINFIEQGTLACGGMAVVRKQAYYSNIVTGGDIRCHQSSKIIGGRLIAEGEIAVGDVGSENARPALLASGVIAERLDHFEALKAKVVEQQDAIIQWLQLYHGSANSKKVRNMEKELAEVKLLLLQVNLIPGTDLYSRAGGPENDPLAAPPPGTTDLEKIKIEVKGTVFASTRIQLGNCSMILDKTVGNRTFKLHPNGKRIIVVPNKR